MRHTYINYVMKKKQTIRYTFRFFNKHKPIIELVITLLYIYNPTMSYKQSTDNS